MNQTQKRRLNKKLEEWKKKVDKFKRQSTCTDFVDLRPTTPNRTFTMEDNINDQLDFDGDLFLSCFKLGFKESLKKGKFWTESELHEMTTDYYSRNFNDNNHRGRVLAQRYMRARKKRKLNLKVQQMKIGMMEDQDGQDSLLITNQDIEEILAPWQPERADPLSKIQKQKLKVALKRFYVGHSYYILKKSSKSLMTTFNLKPTEFYHSCHLYKTQKILDSVQRVLEMGNHIQIDGGDEDGVKISRTFQGFTREPIFGQRLVNTILEQMRLHEGRRTLKQIQSTYHESYPDLPNPSLQTISRYLTSVMNFSKKVTPAVPEGRNTETSKNWSFYYMSEVFMRRSRRGHRFVSLDETGFNLCERAKTHWAPKGKNWSFKSNTKSFKNVTVIIAIEEDQILGLMFVKGGCNSLIFFHFLKKLTDMLNCSNPGINNKITFLMDNASIHKAHPIRGLITKRRLHVLLCPPYRPMLNPVEFLNKDLKRIAYRTPIENW